SNYSALRRYPNPLNPAATQRGIELTHEAYKKHLGDLHSYIEAYFTDEPSLNAVNIGTIPSDVQQRVFIADPLDENVPLLPMLAWSDELEKMNFNKKSLFTGDSEADKAERQRFWSTAARLNTDYYYRAIQDWCRKNDVLSSGHTLHEENLLGHIPLDGNKISVLRAMDIPGLDLLNSNPSGFRYGQWKTCGFPASAAALNGTRLVFTEISDFAQKMGGDKKPAPLSWMYAAAASQAAFGITEFTLYYRIDDRPLEQYRAYCRYVGRLNAVLREAKPVYDVLLFYPVSAMQREYRPTAEPLNIKNQSETAQMISQSFEEIGTRLVRNQVPFVIADEQGIKDWKKMHGDSPMVIVPRGVELPKEIKGDVFEINEALFDEISGVFAASPAATQPSTDIILGLFSRDDYTIYLLVNIADKPYQGKMRLPFWNEKMSAALLFPDTGAQQSVTMEKGELPISLEPLQSVFVVMLNGQVRWGWGYSFQRL
ncbi:MAG: hypothetical protein FWE67_13980, partial [Planctomycetaceae bacterium]|nr:hypothetical protein [Planctomycetaceae bacterium]